MNREEKFIRARIQLLEKHPFFGYLALQLRVDWEVSKRIDWQKEGADAMIDSDGNIWFDPNEFDRMSSDELMYHLAHEAVHIAFEHLSWKGGFGRRGKRDPRRWNLAADIATNNMLSHSLPVPYGAPQCYEWEKKTAEEIFDLLKTKQQLVSGGQQFDKHIILPPGKQERKIDWKQMVAKAATYARQQGKMPGELETIVDKLLYPNMDWRSILFNFMSNLLREHLSWARPNRKFVWQKIYLPGPSQASPEIVFAVDSSGSIRKPEFAMMFGAVQEILWIFQDNPKITVIECDHKVQKVYPHISDADMVKLRRRGWGGTSFIPVFEWIEKEGIIPDVLLYATDGWGTFPDKPPHYPVIWLINTLKKVPWGIRIQFPRLTED